MSTESKRALFAYVCSVRRNSRSARATAPHPSSYSICTRAANRVPPFKGVNENKQTMGYGAINRPPIPVGPLFRVECRKSSFSNPALHSSFRPPPHGDIMGTLIICQHLADPHQTNGVNPIADVTCNCLRRRSGNASTNFDPLHGVGFTTQSADIEGIHDGS